MNSTFPSRDSIFGLAALTLAMLCVTPAEAWAYIDPGSGSYLFQLGAAALLAGVYTVRRQWHALVTALRGRTAHANVRDLPSQRSNDVE